MCGILGIVGRSAVNQSLYDGLLLLQHRGQDAAGIATSHGRQFSMHKGNGLVRDVFRTRNMRTLLGSSGLGHVRYPTAGSASNDEEAQPFYVNAPFGVTLAHNGNLINAAALKEEMFLRDRRHINTDSDSEVLLNVLAQRTAGACQGRLARSGDDLRRGQGVPAACPRRLRLRGRDRRLRPARRFATRTASARSATACAETDAGTEYLDRLRVGGARGAGIPLRPRHRAGRGDLRRSSTATSTAEQCVPRTRR